MYLPQSLGPQRVVDIKKSIFRLIRKFWKNYKKNRKYKPQLRKEFSKFLQRIDPKTKEVIQNNIGYFE